MLRLTWVQPEDLLGPDTSLSIREGAHAAWPGAWQGPNRRRIVKNLGIDVDRPWRELSREDRDWLLFTDEQPSVLIRPQDKDGGGGRDYHGTFRSARRHVRQVQKHCEPGNLLCRPRQRQALLHWAYDSRKI